MKNMIKNMICTMMLIAAVAAMPAIASARDNQDVYTCDCYTLVLRDQASYNAPITFVAEDAYGYEMDVQDYLNGFGYCYVPAFGVNGWVDMDDVYYLDSKDAYDYMSYDAYNYKGYDAYDYMNYGAYDYDDGYELCYSNVASGFLALRSYPVYSDANILAEIYDNGTALYMTGEYSGNYGYCYVPEFDLYGWVDVRYIY